jgi:hypothetical protein
MPRKRAPTKPPTNPDRRTLKPIPKKPRGAPFKKGKPRAATAGRKKGTGNAIPHDMKTFLTAFVEGDEAYKEALKGRLREGKAPQIELLAHHYSGGKPKETVDLGAGTLADILKMAHELRNAKRA